SAVRTCQGFPCSSAMRARPWRGCARPPPRRFRLPLNWFRRRSAASKEQAPAQPSAAAPREAPAEPLPSEQPAPAPAVDGEQSSAARKRRRGSRGGRGRKKPAAATATAVEEVVEA